MNRTRLGSISLRLAPRSRARVLDVGPFALLLAATWMKVSYFNLPPQSPNGNEWYAWQFREAAKATAGSMGLLLVILAPLLLVRPARRFVALWAADLGVTLLVVSNVVHFRYFGDVMSVASMSAGWQVGLVFRSVLALLHPVDLLLFADLAAALLLLRPYRRALAALPHHDRTVAAPGRTAVASLVGLGLVALAAGPVRTVVRDDGDTFHYNYFRFFGVRKIGLLNYHVYEGGRSLYTTLVAPHRTSPAERDRALRLVDAWRREATAPSGLFGAARGRSVIFVMVESLHAFPLGLRVDGREVTPHLNALARRSMHFENFYSQTWEGSTSDGEWTSLQSLHPLPAGAVATTHPTNRFRGLPQVLAERGYATLSAHAYYGDLWRMREMHRSLGFQRSHFREDYTAGEPVGMGGIPDDVFFRQTVPRLEALPRPFMAYLMTITTHHPYRLPDQHKRMPVQGLEGTTLGDYLHTVRYLDAAVGELVAGLERRGILDDAVLVLYGDHRADLGDPADLERLLTRHAGFAPARGDFDARFWRERNRLPLLVRLPGDRAAGVRSVSGGHLDIAPTVLGLLGVRDPRMPLLGRDLTQGVHSQVTLRSGGFVLQDTVCVVPDATLPTRRCADVRSGRALDTARFRHRYDAARERLRVSDVLIRGNLVDARR